MIRVFVDDDAGYMHWLERNPEGFVVNTYHSLDASYSCLHRATCSSISTYTAKARRKGGFTERQYAKVCSDKADDLRLWARDNGGPDGSISNFCSKCRTHLVLKREGVSQLEGESSNSEENHSARVNERITLHREDVLRLLRSTAPLSRSGSYKNFFVIRDNGEKLGAKAIVFELSGGADHHGNQAALALMQLGIQVHVQKWMKTYDRSPWRGFLQKGLLVVEGTANVVPPTTSVRARLLAAQLEGKGVFNPDNTEDAREKTLRAIVQRAGQPAFREALLEAYCGRCAVTGCPVADVLEAAHITPYRGKQTNHVQNGLLLRADIHTLFDLGLVAIDASRGAFRLVISNALAGSEYAQFAGREASVPKDPRLAPSREALERHREEAGL